MPNSNWEEGGRCAGGLVDLIGWDGAWCSVGRFRAAEVAVTTTSDAASEGAVCQARIDYPASMPRKLDLAHQRSPWMRNKSSEKGNMGEEGHKREQVVADLAVSSWLLVNASF